MRITNQMILARSLESVQQGLEDTARLERQITTGRRYQRLSEAPVDGRSVLDIDGDLRAAEQYGRNIEAARARLAVADTTLDSLTGILVRVREIAVQQGGGLATPASRQAAMLEVQELRDGAIQLANQRHNGAYVFGGSYTDLPPLDATGALDPTFPARGPQEYEIGPGVTTPAAHDAGVVFIDSDLMGTLDALEAALAADDPAAIQAAADRATVTVQTLQLFVTDIGARQVRLDLAQDNQAIVTDALRARRSTLIDVRLEEAVTLLASRQATYQATLLATSRVLETSLVNFLR